MQNTFPVVNELSNPTPNRIIAVLASAIVTAAAVHFVAASAGYATFGSAVQSNILRNYPGDMRLSTFVDII